MNGGSWEMNEERKEQAIAVWTDVCARMREKSKSACEAWLMRATPLDINDEFILIGVSDGFFGNILLEHFGKDIREYLFAITGKNLEVKYEEGFNPPPLTLIDEDDEKKILPTDYTTIINEIEPHPTDSPEKKDTFVVAPNCQRQHVFSTFVVGEENRYAFTAAKAVGEKPGQAYNPLYIYGGPGMGKTHLIQAIANSVANSFPNFVVRYVTCENFLNEYVDALRQQKHREFCDAFRHVDILLIDDIHQLSEKGGLQEEFFNTFNTLYNQGKQIVLTSDKQPSEIKGVEARLISRFQMGATVEITQSSYETRLAILRQERDQYGMEADDDALGYIAKHIRSNIRPLKGAMMRLQIYASANHIPITLQNVSEQLSGLLEDVDELPKISIAQVQQVVAEHFGLHIQDLTGSKRTKHIANARLIAMYLCRKMTPEVLQQIGEQFGGRSHAAVLHAFNLIEEQCINDESVKNLLSMLQKKITSGRN